MGMRCSSTESEFLKVLPLFTQKTLGAVLPAFADENHSFLEPISYFCVNELVSFLAGKTPVGP